MWRAFNNISGNKTQEINGSHFMALPAIDQLSLYPYQGGGRRFLGRSDYSERNSYSRKQRRTSCQSVAS